MIVAEKLSIDKFIEVGFSIHRSFAVLCKRQSIAMLTATGPKCQRRGGDSQIFRGGLPIQKTRDRRIRRNISVHFFLA